MIFPEGEGSRVNLSGRLARQRGYRPGPGLPAAALTLLICLTSPAVVAVGSTVHHDLNVRIYPERNLIEATDTLTLPDAMLDLAVKLHPSLAEAAQPATGEIHREETAEPGLVVFTRMIPGRQFAFSYRGTIHDPPAPSGRETARGQLATSGTIGETGVYLGSGAGWFPQVMEGYGADRLTFDLTVELPPGWDAVSQGIRTRRGSTEKGTVVRWVCDRPQDGIWLSANRFRLWERDAGKVRAMVYLLQDDPELAARYLDATAQYLKMYQDLIGQYPYEKFATVENFWETGYGLPSFTLLGPRVIRFPFILQSSLPHEILHNWWGNSVFIDYRSGNWGEGLTTYLADHLLKEQAGQGAEYRREVLQRYTDYALKGRDLPLTGFKARHGSVTEAVGYGKSMMLFHMLRDSIGDELFRQGLRRFYEDNRFELADFDSLRRSFEEVSGRDLGAFFQQWVRRTGAPEIVLSEAAVRSQGGGYELTVSLRQVQEGEPYRLDVPLAVTVDGADEATWLRIPMTGSGGTATWTSPGRPLRVDVDPAFDLFRRLTRGESPPALTQVFGADEALAVLPFKASTRMREGYRRLAASLGQAGPGTVKTVLDSDLRRIPDEIPVWVLGEENLWAAEVLAGLDRYGFRRGRNGFSIAGKSFPSTGSATVLVSGRQGGGGLSDVFLSVADPDAVGGLARKLPHYRKYSYLGFEGSEPVNVLKGRWPSAGSALTRVLAQPDRPVSMGALPPRPLLCCLPPPFSADRMVADVRRLSAGEMEGRGPGSDGLDLAAVYVAAAFREAGLKPFNGTSYYQEWSGEEGRDGGAARLRNVVGVLPGAGKEGDGRSVVVGAHYDHLGRGRPGGLPLNLGRLHPGANDNASGVAVLLELARVMAAGEPPARSVVFAAFTAEEEGRLGSAHYVSEEGDYPARRIIGMVNLDTVGRMIDDRLLVLGAESSPDWSGLLETAGRAAGVKTVPSSGQLDASDQVSFHRVGVPAIQLYTGPTVDYHKPSDTPDKVEASSLLKTAAVAAALMAQLAGREDQLAGGTLSGGDALEENNGTGESGVNLGIVPDFNFRGEGVRINDTASGLPAAAAGLRPGDIIVAIGGRVVKSLFGLSDVVRDLEPGQRVALKFRRGGETVTAEVTFPAR